MHGYTVAHCLVTDQRKRVNRSNRKPLKPWMFIYIGLAAAIVLAGRPADVATQDSMLPVPAIVGSAPLFRKDI